MYCSNCGTKNEKEAKFCENCGAKLEEEKKQTKKQLTKKNKIIIAITLVIIILLIGMYILKNNTSPEKIALNYYKAYVNQNIDKMYSYTNLKEGGIFTNKDAFKKYYSSSEKKSDAKTIKNYETTNVEYDESNLTATVTITYISGEAGTKTDKITLSKQKDKKYGIFDNWKVSLSSSDIVSNYTINVPKNSKVTVEGKNISSNYIKKNKETYYDSYVIPMMFKTEYNVNVKLSNGFEIKDKINPNGYYNYSKINLTQNNISDKDKNTLKSQIEKDIKTLYDSAISDKKWSEISSTFGKKDLDDLETEYENISNKVDGGFFSHQIKSFDIKDISIKNISDEEGLIRVYFKMNYKYTYQETDEEKTSSAYPYVYYSCENGKLQLKDVSSLPSYF